MFMEIVGFTLVIGFLIVSPIYCIILIATDGEGPIFIIGTILEFLSVVLPFLISGIYLLILLGKSIF